MINVANVNVIFAAPSLSDFAVQSQELLTNAKQNIAFVSCFCMQTKLYQPKTLHKAQG